MDATRDAGCVVVGRVEGDDEDVACTYEDVTVGEAHDLFELSLAEAEGFDSYAALKADGRQVFINHTFTSDAAIKDCS